MHNFYVKKLWDNSQIRDSKEIFINKSILQLVMLNVDVDVRVTLAFIQRYFIAFYDVDRSLSGQRHPVLIRH